MGGLGGCLSSIMTASLKVNKCINLHEKELKMGVNGLDLWNKCGTFKSEKLRDGINFRNAAFDLVIKCHCSCRNE